MKPRGPKPSSPESKSTLPFGERVGDPVDRLQGALHAVTVWKIVCLRVAVDEREPAAAAHPRGPAGAARRC